MNNQSFAPAKTTPDQSETRSVSKSVNVAGSQMIRGTKDRSVLKGKIILHVGIKDDLKNGIFGHPMVVVDRLMDLIASDVFPEIEVVNGADWIDDGIEGRR